MRHSYRATGREWERWREWGMLEVCRLADQRIRFGNQFCICIAFAFAAFACHRSKERKRERMRSVVWKRKSNQRCWSLEINVALSLYLCIGVPIYRNVRRCLCWRWANASSERDEPPMWRNGQRARVRRQKRRIWCDVAQFTTHIHTAFIMLLRRQKQISI